MSSVFVNLVSDMYRYLLEAAISTFLSSQFLLFRRDRETHAPRHWDPMEAAWGVVVAEEWHLDLQN